MSNTAAGIIFILMALFMIVFRVPFARQSVEFQNRVFRFRFGEKAIRQTELACILAGAVIIIMGILMWLGVFGSK